MKCIIDIPDKYVDMCKGLINVFGDVDEDDVEDVKLLESLKGREITLDLNVMGASKAKEFYVAMVMMAGHQEFFKDKGEV